MVELGEAKDYLRHFRFDDDVSRFVCINWLVISKGWRVSRNDSNRLQHHRTKENIDLKYIIFFGAFLPLSPLAWLARLNFFGFFVFFIPRYRWLPLFSVSPIENKKKIISTRIFVAIVPFPKQNIAQMPALVLIPILRKKFESSGVLVLCLWPHLSVLGARVFSAKIMGKHTFNTRTNLSTASAGRKQILICFCLRK